MSFSEEDDSCKLNWLVIAICIDHIYVLYLKFYSDMWVGHLKFQDGTIYIT